MQTLLEYRDLRDRGIPYSEEHLRRLSLKDEFPKPIKLAGSGPGARKAWVEAEITAWIAKRIAARDEAAAA